MLLNKTITITKKQLLEKINHLDDNDLLVVNIHNKDDIDNINNNLNYNMIDKECLYNGICDYMNDLLISNEDDEKDQLINKNIYRF